jgi:hypothetical protein
MKTNFLKYKMNSKNKMNSKLNCYIKLNFNLIKIINEYVMIAKETVKEKI